MRLNHAMKWTGFNQPWREDHRRARELADRLRSFVPQSFPEPGEIRL